MHVCLFAPPSLKATMRTRKVSLCVSRQLLSSYHGWRKRLLLISACGLTFFRLFLLFLLFITLERSAYFLLTTTTMVMGTGIINVLLVDHFVLTQSIESCLVLLCSSRDISRRSQSSLANSINLRNIFSKANLSIETFSVDDHARHTVANKV